MDLVYNGFRGKFGSAQNRKTLVERDLGIMISSDLKWANQTVKATNAAKSIIAQLRNSFTYFDAELVRLLYVSLSRPYLEYAIPVWNPSLKKDILENMHLQFLDHVAYYFGHF